MFERTIGVGMAILALVGCQGSGAAQDPAANPSAPSTLAASSVERPWKVEMTWTVTGIQWAGVPGQATSLFGGRCSVPSDYVIEAVFDGEATHAGRVTGSGSHCSQVAWSAQGPTGATYTDGRGTLKAADGSTLELRYGPGLTGVDPATGKLWFRDPFTFTGGTRRFAGATGGGEEGGSFNDFSEVLGGVPIPMWMKGTITY